MAIKDIMKNIGGVKLEDFKAKCGGVGDKKRDAAGGKPSVAKPPEVGEQSVAADPRPRDQWGHFLPWPDDNRPIPKPTQPSETAPTGELAGMGQIPVEWGVLPANASLAAEIGWVQANRLQIVEERGSSPAIVHLERARSPAPSLAALGWLETSIRSYAKYVDVVARSLSTVQDEQDQVRRERMRVSEVEAVLAESLNV